MSGMRRSTMASSTGSRAAMLETGRPAGGGAHRVAVGRQDLGEERQGHGIVVGDEQRGGRGHAVSTGGGQADPEDAAPARRALHLDRALVIADDLGRDEQAEAGAAPGLLRGEERLEDLPPLRRAHPLPAVPHLHDHLAAIGVGPRRDLDPAPGRAWRPWHW